MPIRPTLNREEPAWWKLSSQIDPDARDQADYFEVVARLNPGVTLAAAQARLRVSTAEYRAKFPNTLGPKESFTVRPLREDLVGGERPLLLVLSGGVSLVLLIALRQPGEFVAGAGRGPKARDRDPRRDGCRTRRSGRPRLLDRRSPCMAPSCWP